MHQANPVVTQEHGPTDQRRRPFPLHVSGEPRPFPLEPVVAWLLPAGAGWATPGDYTVGVVSAVAKRLGVDRNWVYRNLHGGLGVYVADAVAVRLRVHPVAIWEDWFEHAPDDEELDANEARDRQRAIWREKRRRLKAARLAA